MLAEQRLNALYTLHAPAIRKAGYAWCPTPTYTPDDLVQDTFTRAWHHIEELDPATARAWLVTVARRIAVDALRRASARPRTQQFTELAKTDSIHNRRSTVEPASPCDDMQQVLDRITVVRALAAIAPRQREVLVLQYVYGLTVDEVAARLDVPVGTVKSRAHYGLAAMRNRVAEVAHV